MQARKLIAERLKKDLLGPLEDKEIFSDRPTDRYLTGILYPQEIGLGAEQDDEAETIANNAEAGQEKESVSLSTSFRPASAGLSFALRPGKGGIAAIRVTVSCARYVETEPPEKEEKQKDENRKPGTTQRQATQWKRLPQTAVLEDFLLMSDETEPETELSTYGIAGMALHCRISPWSDTLLVTLALSNTNRVLEKKRSRIEEACFFQVEMQIEPLHGTRIVPKPEALRHSDPDYETRSAALIYRHAADYAVGHTCSAEWNLENGHVTCVRTSWLPQALVPSVSASGDEIFAPLTDAKKQPSPLDSRWLSKAGKEELVEALSALPRCYGDWIAARERELSDIPAHLQEQAKSHMEKCRKAMMRMEKGIAMLRDQDEACDAFRLANRAISLQHTWKPRGELIWRPFQLAFVLLSLASASNKDDPDRKIMDLLWFPTGGGKTEAYLLLTAHVIFLRRLRAKGAEAGNGVTVFMRYTLRLLTVQQFQRAAALICACELVRLGRESSGAVQIPDFLRKGVPISIGLWVGNDSSPNKVIDAIKALKPGSDDSSPAQMSTCPCCGSKELKWTSSPEKDRILVHCPNEECQLGADGEPLPVWTVDEDIYRELPSLLIATADKYAQIARNPQTGRLFGINTLCLPPDLIIQDELHLISGPLGTLAGIYEIAVDELCSHAGKRPKIIGSTATIRQAGQQIRALFDRTAFQFPPPGLDQHNSAFSVTDWKAPGRLYLGITTAGRSAKFTLQAVAASLLQSASVIERAEKDYYWTLVAYFNSLRELGGALVLMQDDVDRSIDELANRHGEEAREAGELVELTSRVGSSDIPEMLEQLETSAEEEDCVDITLASNMISVGVDVSRLGLMLVNGQPKSIAEYIQATSRVGRGNVPGLVLTIYNTGKARDRSRFETFSNWHQSLYRDVEATSVTPFASRARDRAQHAAFVAMARHLIPGLQESPATAADHEEELREIIDRIVNRAEQLDPAEAGIVKEELEDRLEQWIDMEPVKYWDDFKGLGLMISAESAAEQSAAGRLANRAWSTPNSLRSVEASTSFALLSGLSSQKKEQQ